MWGGLAGWFSVLISIANRINHFEHEQRPAEPHLGHFDYSKGDNDDWLAAAWDHLRVVATNSRRWTDGRRRLSQATNAVGGFLCPGAGNGIAAGGMQLEVDHVYNHRHTRWNLYGHSERNVGFSHEDDNGSVHGSVGIVERSRAGNHGTRLSTAAAVSSAPITPCSLTQSPNFSEGTLRSRTIYSRQ
jgi:hypothetical protein